MINLIDNFKTLEDTLTTEMALGLSESGVLDEAEQHTCEVIEIDFQKTVYDLEVIEAEALSDIPGSDSTKNAVALIELFQVLGVEYWQKVFNAVPITALKMIAQEVQGTLEFQDRNSFTSDEVTVLSNRIQPVIEKSFDAGLDKYINNWDKMTALGYSNGANEIADHLAEQFNVKESTADRRASAWIQGMQEDPAFFDQPYADAILRWARLNSGTKIKSFNDTNRLQLGQAIARQMSQERRGVPEISRSIKNEFSTIGNYRALMIAHTELRFATSTGAYDRAGSLGVQEKKWLTVGDDRVSTEICKPNQASGKKQMNFSFIPGVMHTPGHPNCRCTMQYFGATKSSVTQGLSDEGTNDWLAKLALKVGMTL